MPQRTQRGHGPKGPSGSLQSGLAQADALIAARRLADAAQVLAELDGRFGDNADVLGRLMNLAVAADDPQAMLTAAEPLARLRPNEPEVALNLAVARLKLQRFALAERSFAAFAERWPAHPKAADARRQAGELREYLGALWSSQGMDEPPDLALMAQNEEVQQLLTAGDWARAVRLAEQVLRARPGFVAIRNNLSLAYQQLGQSERAIAAAREGLAYDPENLHALANLTRFLVLAGRIDEAAETAEQLKAVPALTVDIAVKQAEALSFLGDDAGVLAAFEQVQRLKDRDANSTASALLHHLAAVAAMREGSAQAARRRWQKALELEPSLELAAGNMADLERPEDERHAPWPYSIEYWLQRPTIEALVRELKPGKGRSDEALTRDAQRFLKRYPGLEALVPLLLERGDPSAREFALRLAGLARTPGMLAALAAFAQGQYGPTSLRMQAAQMAQQGGAIGGGTMRFHQGGEWRETVMFGLELHGEPSPSPLPRAAEALQREAAMAQRAGDPLKAERLLKRALELAPDEPSLLNNLGAAYGLLGRIAESEAIARRLIAEHPDYLFGMTNMVPYLLEEGKLDEAQAMIDPLMKRTRMHFSEFGAVASAQINIHLAKNNLEAAESWLDMIAKAVPDYPHIEHFKARLRAAKYSGGRTKRGRR